MAQSLEKRMNDIEYIIAHLPDDLNARFAGVDVKIATIRETQLLHTQRFSTLERKIEGLDQRLDALDGLMGGLDSRMGGLDGRMDGLDDQMDGLGGRMDRMEAKVDQLGTELGGKIDLILARLPSL